VAVLAWRHQRSAVASEAQVALHCHGLAAELLLDVGVAGLHRLLERLEALAEVDVLIACAGMEGALPTVLAGLLPQPVIGVPVSVGYGVSAGGRAALQRHAGQLRAGPVRGECGQRLWGRHGGPAHPQT
jgi:pyridinium-3,5-biscarboxylic acid mononucleotide synthase